MLLDERVLRFIVTLGEELHFGRAAAKLYVSQPALSATVRTLERDLGVELFQRNSRHVELTDAGRILVDEARILMARVDRVVSLVRDSSSAVSAPLRFGYSPLINLPWLCSLASRTRSELNLGPKVDYSSIEAADAIRQLAKGKLHGAIVMGHVCDPELGSHLLFRQQLMVAMSLEHPLAGLENLTFEYLRGEPIIWLRRDLNPFLYDNFLPLCSARGYQPDVVREVTTLHECIEFAANGLGITFLPVSERNLLFDSGVILSALAEPSVSISTQFTYRLDINSEALKALLHLLGDIVPEQLAISVSD